MAETPRSKPIIVILPCLSLMGGIHISQWAYHILLVPVILESAYFPNWLKGRIYFKTENIVAPLNVNKETQCPVCFWPQFCQLSKNEPENKVYIPKIEEKRDENNSGSLNLFTLNSIPTLEILWYEVVNTIFYIGFSFLLANIILATKTLNKWSTFSEALPSFMGSLA